MRTISLKGGVLLKGKCIHKNTSKRAPNKKKPETTTKEVKNVMKKLKSLSVGEGSRLKPIVDNEIKARDYISF